SYRTPALSVSRDVTFQSSLMNAPMDVWLMCRSVAPNDRDAFSKRASSKPTSASTSPLLRPFAVRLVRAWLRTLRLYALPHLAPIFTVCSPRVCVSVADSWRFVVGAVVIG